MNRYVSDAVIRRLPGYYRHLRELEASGVTQISSQELGERMRLTPSQIRQDINCFGGFGRQGYGYKVSELKSHLAEILAIHAPHTMIIIGAGRLGTAIVHYRGFQREGFMTLALFDTDPSRVGQMEDDLPVLGMDQLESFLANQPVDIAVLTVPVENAQEIADRVVQCGIKAIWNFAPTDLNCPNDVVVVNGHLSDSIEILSYRMAHRE